VRLIAPILEDAESDGNSRKFSEGVTRQGSWLLRRSLALTEGYYARESPNRAAHVETVCKTLHEVCFSGLTHRLQVI
jgi:hypothetical protein